MIAGKKLKICSRPFFNQHCLYRPGDHVVWKNEGFKRPAIVQSVDAIQRTALILFPDTGTIELASLLELDSHGNSDLDTGSDASFGVRRGDFVFIHPPETTNGLENPRVPRIGEIEPWIRENPFQDGQFVGWRKELQELGLTIASQRSTGTLVEKKVQISRNADSNLFWCGEVTAVCFALLYIDKNNHDIFQLAQFRRHY